MADGDLGVVIVSVVVLAADTDALSGMYQLTVSGGIIHVAVGKVFLQPKAL